MNLFCFGLGYSALAFVRRERDRFASVAGTVTSAGKARALAAEGVEARVFDEDATIEDDLARSDAILISVPPLPGHDDPVLARYRDAIAASRVAWIGYLSTIGVYGDHQGGWVDETTPPAPSGARSVARLAAERDWLAFGERTGKAVQIFRLAGIYGPGRNALVQVANGSARRLVKPGQVFNRIHVDDIAAVLAASLARPHPGAIYNVADAEPAPPQDVVAFAAALLGAEPPPETPFGQAELSPMAASFYAENKRARAALLRDELGVTLRYPSYREGLSALAAAGEGGAAA